MPDEIYTKPFEAAYRLAPVPTRDGTTDEWIRFHAAQALAAWTVFDRDVKFYIDHPTQGGRPEIGYLSALGIAATHAAAALEDPSSIPALLWELTPEAGALNGEWEDWVVGTLDRLGINPADINGEYLAADFSSPSQVESVDAR